MTPERLSYFRDRLLALEKEIQATLEASKEDSGVVELDTAIGRLSRMDAMQNQQMALELRRRQEQQLQRIANALKRMNQNRYGLCGRCKQPIAEERLEVCMAITLLTPPPSGRWWLCSRGCGGPHREMRGAHVQQLCWGARIA